MPSIKAAKNKAWKVFAEYIRLRDANAQGYCYCISCGVARYWKGDGMQAGHLIPSRCNNILFDEELVHAQCAMCNFNSGEQVAFWRGLKEKMGYDDSKFDEFKNRKNLIKKYSYADYQEIIDTYTDKIIGLMLQKGLGGE